MKGRNGSTSFLPLNRKGGLITNVCPENCLTEDQTKYVYDKVESGDELTVRKGSQQIQNKTLLLNQLKERKDINLYEKVLVRDVNTMDKNKPQMEQWSILTDNIVYVRSVSNDDMNGVDIKMVHYCDHRRMYRKNG